MLDCAYILMTSPSISPGSVDPDGMHATSCAWTEAIGYNTNLVKREDAPKS